MYRNWRIKKSDLLNEELAEELQNQQYEVADWCTENQQFRINDDDEYIFVEPIEEPSVDEKKSSVRDVRDRYLELYVDPIVTNPLRWEELSEDKQNEIKNYRRYLLDYTNNNDWWEQTPDTLEDWLNA